MYMSNSKGTGKHFGSRRASRATTGTTFLSQKATKNLHKAILDGHIMFTIHSFKMAHGEPGTR